MNSFSSSDQSDFDNISRSLNNINNNINETNSTLKHEFGTQKSLLSSIGNGITSVGRGVSSGYNAIKDDYGINTRNTRLTFGALAGGPIGAAMQDIVSKITSNISFGGRSKIDNIDGLMNKFHGHSEPIEKLGDLQEKQIQQDKKNTDDIIKAIKNPSKANDGTERRRNNNNRRGGYGDGNIAHNNGLYNISHGNGFSAPGDVANMLASIIKNQEKMNELFTDPNATKTGLLHTFADFATTMTGVKFWFHGRYARDIQRSSNPLTTITDALIKIYEWQRIGLDLNKRQLNELIKATGGVPQKEVGHESAATAFLKKKGAQINNWFDRSSMAKIPILGTLGKGATRTLTMFVGYSDEDWKDFAYAKGHSMLDSMGKERSIKKVTSHFYDTHNVNRYKSALGADLDNASHDKYLEDTIRSIRKFDKGKFNEFKNDKIVRQAIEQVNEVSTSDLDTKSKKKALKVVLKNLQKQIRNAQEDYGVYSLVDPLFDVKSPGRGLFKDKETWNRLLNGEKIKFNDIITYTEDVEDAKKTELLKTLKEKIDSEKDPSKIDSLIEKYTFTKASLDRDKLSGGSIKSTYSPFGTKNGINEYSPVIVDRLTNIQATLEDIDYNFIDRISSGVIFSNKELVKDLEGINIGNNREAYIQEFIDKIHQKDRDRSGKLTEAGSDDITQEDIRDSVREIADRIKNAEFLDDSNTNKKKRKNNSEDGGFWNWLLGGAKSFAESSLKFALANPLITLLGSAAAVTALNKLFNGNKNTSWINDPNGPTVGGSMAWSMLKNPIDTLLAQQAILGKTGLAKIIDPLEAVYHTLNKDGLEAAKAIGRTLLDFKSPIGAATGQLGRLLGNFLTEFNTEEGFKFQWKDSNGQVHTIDVGTNGETLANTAERVGIHVGNVYDSRSKFRQAQYDRAQQDLVDKTKNARKLANEQRTTQKALDQWNNVNDNPTGQQIKGTRVVDTKLKQELVDDIVTRAKSSLPEGYVTDDVLASIRQDATRHVDDFFKSGGRKIKANKANNLVKTTTSKIINAHKTQNIATLTRKSTETAARLTSLNDDILNAKNARDALTGAGIKGVTKVGTKVASSALSVVGAGMDVYSAINYIKDQEVGKGIATSASAGLNAIAATAVWFGPAGAMCATVCGLAAFAINMGVFVWDLKDAADDKTAMWWIRRAYADMSFWNDEIYKQWAEILLNKDINNHDKRLQLAESYKKFYETVKKTRLIAYNAYKSNKKFRKQYSIIIDKALKKFSMAGLSENSPEVVNAISCLYMLWMSTHQEELLLETNEQFSEDDLKLIEDEYEKYDKSYAKDIEDIQNNSSLDSATKQLLIRERTNQRNQYVISVLALSKEKREYLESGRRDIIDKHGLTEFGGFWDWATGSYDGLTDEEYMDSEKVTSSHKTVAKQARNDIAFQNRLAELASKDGKLKQALSDSLTRDITLYDQYSKFLINQLNKKLYDNGQISEKFNAEKIKHSISLEEKYLKEIFSNEKFLQYIEQNDSSKNIKETIKRYGNASDYYILKFNFIDKFIENLKNKKYDSDDKLKKVFKTISTSIYLKQNSDITTEILYNIFYLQESIIKTDPEKFRESIYREISIITPKQHQSYSGTVIGEVSVSTDAPSILTLIKLSRRQIIKSYYEWRIQTGQIQNDGKSSFVFGALVQNENDKTLSSDAKKIALDAWKANANKQGLSGINALVGTSTRSLLNSKDNKFSATDLNYKNYSILSTAFGINLEDGNLDNVDFITQQVISLRGKEIQNVLKDVNLTDEEKVEQIQQISENAKEQIKSEGKDFDLKSELKKAGVSESQIKKFNIGGSSFKYDTKKLEESIKKLSETIDKKEKETITSLDIENSKVLNGIRGEISSLIAVTSGVGEGINNLSQQLNPLVQVIKIKYGQHENIQSEKLAHGGISVANSPQYGMTSQGTPYVWGEAGPEAQIPMGGGNTMYLPLTRRKGNLLDQIINSTQSKLADGGILHAKDASPQVEFISQQVAKNITANGGLEKFSGGAIAKTNDGTERIKVAANNVVKDAIDKGTQVASDAARKTVQVLQDTGVDISSILTQLQKLNPEQLQSIITTAISKAQQVASTTVDNVKKTEVVDQTLKKFHEISNKESVQKFVEHVKKHGGAAADKTKEIGKDVLEEFEKLKSDKDVQEYLAKAKEIGGSAVDFTKEKGREAISKVSELLESDKVKEYTQKAKDAGTKALQKAKEVGGKALSTAKDYMFGDYYYDDDQYQYDENGQLIKDKDGNPVLKEGASPSWKKTYDKDFSVLMGNASDEKIEEAKQRWKVESETVSKVTGKTKLSKERYDKRIKTLQLIEEQKKKKGLKETAEDIAKRKDREKAEEERANKEVFQSESDTKKYLIQRNKESEAKKKARLDKALKYANQRKPDEKSENVISTEDKKQPIKTIKNDVEEFIQSAFSPNDQVIEEDETIKIPDIPQPFSNGVKNNAEEFRNSVKTSSTANLQSATGSAQAKSKQVKVKAKPQTPKQSAEDIKKALERGSKSKQPEATGGDFSDKKIEADKGIEEKIKSDVGIVDAGTQTAEIKESVEKKKNENIAEKAKNVTVNNTQIPESLNETSKVEKLLRDTAIEFAKKGLPKKITEKALNRLAIQNKLTDEDSEDLIDNILFNFSSEKLKYRVPIKTEISDDGKTKTKSWKGKISEFDDLNKFNKNLLNPVIGKDTVTIGDTVINKQIWDQIKNTEETNIKNLDIKHLAEHFDYKKDSKFGTYTDKNYLWNSDESNEKQIIDQISKLKISEIEKQLLIEKFTNNFRSDVKKHYETTKTNKEKSSIITEHLDKKIKEQSERKRIYDELAQSGKTAANNITMQQLHTDYASNIDNVISNSYTNSIATPKIKNHTGLNEYQTQLIQSIQNNKLYTPEQKKTFINELITKFKNDRTNKFTSIRDTEEFKKYHSDYIKQTGSLDYIFPKDVGNTIGGKYKSTGNVYSGDASMDTDFASGGIAHVGSSPANNAVNYISSVVASNIKNQFADGGFTKKLSLGGFLPDAAVNLFTSDGIGTDRDLVEFVTNHIVKHGIDNYLKFAETERWHPIAYIGKMCPIDPKSVPNKDILKKLEKGVPNVDTIEAINNRILELSGEGGLGYIDRARERSRWYHVKDHGEGNEIQINRWLNTPIATAIDKSIVTLQELGFADGGITHDGSKSNGGISDYISSNLGTAITMAKQGYGLYQDAKEQGIIKDITNTNKFVKSIKHVKALKNAQDVTSKITSNLSKFGQAKAVLGKISGVAGAGLSAFNSYKNFKEGEYFQGAMDAGLAGVGLASTFGAMSNPVGLAATLAIQDAKMIHQLCSIYSKKWKEEDAFELKEAMGDVKYFTSGGNHEFIQSIMNNADYDEEDRAKKIAKHYRNWRKDNNLLSVGERAVQVLKDKEFKKSQKHKFKEINSIIKDSGLKGSPTLYLGIVEALHNKWMETKGDPSAKEINLKELLQPKSQIKAFAEGGVIDSTGGVHAVSEKPSFFSKLMGGIKNKAINYAKNKAINYASKNIMPMLSSKIKEFSPEITMVAGAITNSVNTITNKITDSIDLVLPQIEMISNHIQSMSGDLTDLVGHNLKHSNISFNIGPRTTALNTNAMNSVIDNNSTNESNEQMLKGIEKSNTGFVQSTMNLIKNSTNNSNSNGPVINNYHECDRTFRMVESFGIIQ